MVAASASTPRRVGDGGEYLVMALQLAAGRPPSLDAAELGAARQQLAALGGGFESSLLDYPDLVSSDGRQDFLHFFLYPLIVAPALPVVTAIGLHPNWAFTLVNALLLSAALLIVAPRTPLVACLAMFVGPILWWVDKAHTEAFLFAGVAVAALMFREKPSWALIAFALAGAQNAALGVAYAPFALLIWRATRSSTFDVRAGIAAVAGAVIVVLPFLYTWVRLDRLSPMAEYAQRTMPSLPGLAAFVVEPNIGLLPSAPVYAVTLLAVAWLFSRVLMRRNVPIYWWWPLILHLVLLLAWSQNPNANHGGTPGMNRWVLSLLALSIPWIVDVRRIIPPGARQAMNIVVAITAVMSAAAHLPSRPENYREPSRLAERMWNAGWVHVTPAEVFVERTQGREPASAPSHDGTCRVLLIANEQSPVPCAPPVERLPSWCRGAGAMCYAVISDDTSRYVFAPRNGFFYRVAEPSWPAGGPLAAGVHRAMREADPTARVWRPESSRRWRERLAGAEIGVVLRSANVSFVHVLRLSDEARRVIAGTDGLRVVELIPVDPRNADSQLTNLAVIARRTGP